MPEKWQVTDLQPLYLSGANKQRIEEEGSSASYPDPSSSHPAVALLLVPSLTRGTPPAPPPMAHTITRSAAGAYLQTQGGANHAQATWACPSALIHFCAACPSFSLFCLTRAPETRYQHLSLPRMSLPIGPPPGFFHSCWTLIPSPRNTEPISDPDVPTTPYPGALPAHVFATFAKTQGRTLSSCSLACTQAPRPFTMLSVSPLALLPPLHQTVAQTTCSSPLRPFRAQLCPTCQL